MSAFTTAIEYKHTYDRYNTEQNGSTITKFTQKNHTVKMNSVSQQMNIIINLDTPPRATVPVCLGAP